MNVISYQFVKRNRVPSTSTIGCFVETDVYQMLVNNEVHSEFEFKDNPMSYSSYGELLYYRLFDLAQKAFGTDFEMGCYITNMGYIANK